MKLKLSYFSIGFLFIFALSISIANAAIANIPGSIAAKHSGKCLVVLNASATDGAAIIQNSCNGTDNEQWVLRPFQDAYQVVVKHTGKCLNVSSGLTTDGAAIIQWPCVGAANELWYAKPQGDYFQLVAKHSGKCLNVNGGSQNNAEKIIQWSCAATNNEFWRISGLSHTTVLAKHSNQCLDIFGGSVTSGTQAIQWPCHGSSNQQWTLMPYQDAYRLIVKHSGLCLTVANALLTDGAAVNQAACRGTNNELWYVKPNGKHYQLIAKHSNKCLNVNANSQLAGEAINQWTCNSTANQLWQIDTPSTTGGRWSNPIALSLVPVATANLPDGKLLLWSSHDRFSFGGGGKTYTAIFDPSLNQATERLVAETGHDMFCPGTSNLADGRILVNGGVNSELTSIYNPSNQSWTMAQRMNIPRGYQANAVLSNGEVFTLGGSWSGGVGAKNGEVWNSATGWRRTTGIVADSLLTADPAGVYRADNHAWFFGVGNQQVFHAGPSKQMNWFNTASVGSSTAAGSRGNDGHSMNGNAVMYDIGKILKIGGAPAYQNSNATTNAYVIDINNGVTVRQVASMAYARAYNSSVVLPNGQVVIFGGQAYPVPFTDAQPALSAELWNPVTGTFTTLAAMRIPRTYHSAALLMMDGRVFVGGGGLCGTCQTNHANAEIFTPPYLLNADGSNALRPSIMQAPASASYGGSITINTDSAVNAFALVRLSSVTHTVNNDQRRIPLNFTTVGINAYTVTIPSNRGVAIPGYYMLFALNGTGVPSVAKILKIG